MCHTGGHRAQSPVSRTIPIAFAKALHCILAGAKVPFVLETAFSDSLAKSAGCWLSFPGSAGVSIGSKEETQVEVGSPAMEMYCKCGGLTQAVRHGLQGDHLGTSLLVFWLVAPLWHHGAGGAAWWLRKIKWFSEGRIDTHSPTIGNTSVTTWKVIFAT